MIPKYINDIAIKLEKKGFQAYLVGGSLRNLLLGIKPKDFDLATDALPEQISSIFPESIMTNAKFGTVNVLVKNEFQELEEVEITTFRVEKEYTAGRWPSYVEFTRNIEEDLKRRDYTVNALALKLGHDLPLDKVNTIEDLIKTGLIIDLFDGINDIKHKILRAVGDPLERFSEDGLRPLRGCRIASVYNFKFDKKTFDAIPLTLEIAKMVSMERVREEFVRMILESPKPSVGIELMRESGLLQLYIPELLEGYGMKQNKYHLDDVYTHLLKTVDIAPKEIRLAALFHDIGKPRCKEGEHFYGHDKVGAEMTREILKRLKFPNKEIEEISNLVRWHMFYVPKSIKVEEDSKYKPQNIEEQKRIRNEAFKLGWSNKAIRRLILKVGGHEQIDKLLKLRIADALANPRASFDPTDVIRLAEKVAEIRQEQSAISRKDLQINGEDLIKIGYPRGPLIKEALEYLLEKVTSNIKLNNKKTLIKLARKFLDKKQNKLNKDTIKS